MPRRTDISYVRCRIAPVGRLADELHARRAPGQLLTALITRELERYYAILAHTAMRLWPESGAVGAPSAPGASEIGPPVGVSLERWQALLAVADAIFREDDADADTEDTDTPISLPLALVERLWDGDDDDGRDDGDDGDDSGGDGCPCSCVCFTIRDAAERIALHRHRPQHQHQHQHQPAPRPA